MKKTDLEKLKGLKIRGRMKNAGTPDRFAKGAGGGSGEAALNPLIAKLLKKGIGDEQNES